MDQNLSDKKTLIEKITIYYKKNKKKTLFFLSVVIFVLIGLNILREIKKRENILLSEKYIIANLYLSNKQFEVALKNYEEIIVSNNKFYSLLSLNKIIEKDLLDDKNKILLYFEKIEENNYSPELLDLILFKKALYLIKIKELNAGNKILNDLINKNSKLKLLSQEIIK